MARQKSLKDLYVERLIRQLTIEGEQAILEAYNKRTFTNRKYNLHDSYASAVYAHGRLIKSSVRYVGQEMSKSGLPMGWVWNKARSMPDFRGDRRYPGDEVQMNGREEAMDFLSQYTPRKGGVTLIIIAAMFYASILESGGGNLKHKYRVISDGNDIMRRIADKYHGVFETVQTSRLLDMMPTIKDKSWKQ